MKRLTNSHLKIDANRSEERGAEKPFTIHFRGSMTITIALLTIFLGLPMSVFSSSMVEIDPVPLPLIPVKIVPSESGIAVTWEGDRKRLEFSDSVNGPWDSPRRSRSPHIEEFADGEGVRFYRVYDPALYIPRPAKLHIPDTYSDEGPTPLIVSLHGFSGTPETQELVMPMLHLVDAHHFLYLTPAGLRGTINGFPQTA